MAVTFISHGYDTTAANPYTEVAWAEAHPAIGSSQYGLRGPGDWAVTAVAGADRAVSIAPGFGWGSGVTDSTTENETLQLGSVPSGSRWDLIVARRDWTPTAGETKFLAVAGGSTKAIPGGRLRNPGGIDDQPLALVQVTAGQTQPTAIVDLRCWAGNGGMVAKDELAKSYLGVIGAAVNISGTVWRYVLGANDVQGWVAGGSVFSPLPVNAFATTGDVAVEQVPGGRNRVSVNVRVRRTGNKSLSVGTSFIPLGAVLPLQARGGSTGNELYFPISIVAGGANVIAHGSVHPATGIFYVQGVSAFTWPTEGMTTFNCTYFI